ncbi:MAG: hypothetical protein P4L22_03295 [Candidatus Babeliales bacterium]|nr:hypothetical protein [Candidatus Babeliales bacterium]
MNFNKLILLSIVSLFSCSSIFSMDNDQIALKLSANPLAQLKNETDEARAARRTEQEIHVAKAQAAERKRLRIIEQAKAEQRIAYYEALIKSK